MLREGEETRDDGEKVVMRQSHKEKPGLKVKDKTLLRNYGKKREAGMTGET